MLTYVLPGLAIVALVLIVLAIIVALRPADFRISRATRMAAAPAAVFAEVNDLHRWEAWSPYAKRDPAMKKTYEGPPTGVGAVYAWNGNNEVGEGSSTIIESRPSDLIRLRLEFKRPFAGVNTAEFTFQPEGGQTLVTWALLGKFNFVTKAMGLFMSMDKMIGGDFEQGLANLKSVVECRPAAVGS